MEEDTEKVEETEEKTEEKAEETWESGFGPEYLPVPDMYEQDSEPLREPDPEPEIVTYTVTLSDGTVFENLRLNGNNYITTDSVTADDFSGKLDTVTIEGSDGRTEVIRDAEMIAGFPLPGEFWFSLREMPEDKRLKRTISALEDALCEADIANASWQAEIENALCELDKGVE